MNKIRFILKISCPDQAGIVHAVSGVLLAKGGNILTSAQHGDADHSRFFMRIEFECAADVALEELRSAFEPLATKLQMEWTLVAREAKTRVLLLVSKLGHCLNDLLFRVQTGHLPIEIPAIVSNHRDFYQLAASHDIPFHHFPLLNSTEEQKQLQERKMVHQRKNGKALLQHFEACIPHQKHPIHWQFRVDPKSFPPFREQQPNVQILKESTNYFPHAHVHQ